MKGVIKILIIPFLSITLSFGQMIDVTELYPSNKYFFPNFEKIGEDDNLPQYRISSLIEDYDGYVWVGTKDGGLIRYDGYSFNTFEFDPSDQFSLSSNDVIFVFEDSRNILWVATDNSLSYFHPSLKQFMKVKLFTSYDTLSVPRNIKCITEAKNGNLLIGTNIGIFEISNIEKSKFIKQRTPVINHDSVGIKINHILLQPKDPLIAGMIIRDIKYDSTGLLWILSESELGSINYDELLLNESKNNYDNNIDGNYISAIETDEGSRIFIDNSGQVWVNTLHNLVGIKTTSGSTEIEKIPFDSNTESIDDFINSNSVGRKFWLGHYDDNLNLFDAESQKYLPLTFATNDINNIHDNGVSCFLKTRSGVIFIGTAWGGLYKFNPNAALVNYHPNLQAIHQNQTDNLRYVYEDSKGYIWIIAGDIYRCDKNTGEIIATYSDEFFNHKWGYTNNIIEDDKGRFWIGMEGNGLYCIDINNNGRKNPSTWSTTFKSVIKDKTITALYESTAGTIWVGTIYRDLDSAKIYTELFNITLKGNILVKYLISESLLRGGNETDQFINQIYIDNNIIWLATGSGLVRINETSSEIHTFIDNSLTNGYNKMLSVCPDPYAPDSILWLGSANTGLLCFDIKNKQFCLEDNSFELPTNHIASILPDDYGNLWIGTNRGISKVVIDKKGGSISQISNYYNSDGLITSDFTNYYGPNAVKTKNNKLIFTGPRGFQTVDPQNVTRNSIIPHLHITDFTINYKPEDYGQPGSPLKKSISLTEKVVLPYNQNTLGFEVTAHDFKSPEQLTYAFKLENYDDQWIMTKKRTIQYTKLPPGSYKLMVKVVTRDGTWSEGFKGLSIQIESPWWKTIYAYILYGLIFIAGVLFVDWIQRNRQKVRMSIEMNKLEADKLRELDLMKSKFFANISHEFKTPLTLILNPIEEMLIKTECEDRTNSLQMIKRNAKRLQQYISEILELSQLDANRIKLNIRELDIVKFLKYHIASFESLARQKDISLKLKSPEKEIICYLDPQKLNSIVINLLSNAIKFTPKGGSVKIDLSGCFCNQHEHCNQKKGCLIFSVIDTGIGIPENKIPYIFDRYYKVEQKNVDNESSTGLGLALVKELVNLHHGTINVVSEENKFTKFQLHFPMGRYHVKPADLVDDSRYELEEDFSVQPQIKVDTPDQEVEKLTDYNSKIVLVIEDNKDMRTLISAGLKREFQVLVAKDGEEGIARAIENSPDLILCDVMMPKKDGFEVVRTLKTNEITSHIPIILLTARSEMTDKLTGLETGADDYLIKPFHALELKTRVSNLLVQRKKLREKFSKLNILKLDRLPNRSLDQVFLEKVAICIETNMSNEEFGVQMLAQELNISRTQLHRKIKALVNQSTNELIQSIRLQKASEMLINKAGTVAEICYLVGFSSPPYFTRLFKQHFGHNPSEHLGSQT